MYVKINKLTLNITFQMTKSTDLDNEIDELLQDFETRRGRSVLHTVLFY